MVAAPICGVREMLGFIKTLILGLGSFSKTSSPALLTFPFSIADNSAVSSITPPLAAFTIPTPSF